MTQKEFTMVLEDKLNRLIISQKAAKILTWQYFPDPDPEAPGIDVLYPESIVEYKKERGQRRGAIIGGLEVLINVMEGEITGERRIVHSHMLKTLTGCEEPENMIDDARHIHFKQDVLKEKSTYEIAIVPAFELDKRENKLSISMSIKSYEKKETILLSVGYRLFLSHYSDYTEISVDEELLADEYLYPDEKDKSTIDYKFRSWKRFELSMPEGMIQLQSKKGCMDSVLTLWSDNAREYVGIDIISNICLESEVAMNKKFLDISFVPSS